MKFARIAGIGVTTALATAGLVGASAPAHAAPVSTVYTCTPQGGSAFNVPVSVDLALPATAVAGTPIPAGFLTFPVTATVPGLVQTAPGTGLDALGVTGFKSDDFGTTVGDAAIKASATLTKPASSNPAGDYVYTGTGSNAAFVLPKAGTYTATLPKTFNLVTTGATAIPVSCTTATPASIGSITLSKQLVKVTAKSPKSVKSGTVVSVKGKVKAEHAKAGGPTATGKVVVKDGKKKVGTAKIKKGKFVVKVKGLAVGSHKLTVSYKGDPFTNKGVSKELTVTVKA